ncbi:MAG: hypothetical protein LBL86_07840 [Coriobacteriales bacterium]|jgi:hypothetical protein|nr:hypothetical protein [Coriobacteriales bacterium]
MEESATKYRWSSIRGLATGALACILLLAAAMGLAGCGSGGGSGDGAGPAGKAEVAEVSDAPESILNEKIDEFTDEKSSEGGEEDGSGLVGTLSESYVDALIRDNPVIEGKYVLNVYFGVAGAKEAESGLMGTDLAVARAIKKAKAAEGADVDYKAHRIDLNSGCGSTFIAAVNTFTEDKDLACKNFIVRVCATSGVAEMSYGGLRYYRVDTTDLNAGVGGRFLYLLQGHGKAGTPVKEIGFNVSGDSIDAKRNGIQALVFEQQSYNPFSREWRYVVQGEKATLDPKNGVAVDLNVGARGDYVYMAQRFSTD